MKTYTERTRVYQNFRGAWTGETSTTDSGTGWMIITMKRYDGRISSTARKGDFVDSGFCYDMFGGKSIDLITTKGIATQKTISEQHTKALLLFDEHADIKAELSKEVYHIVKGQKLISFGCGMNIDQAKDVVYLVEGSGFSARFFCIDINTLELSIKSHIKDIANIFGIGTYYEKGDMFNDLNELDNLVIEAKKIEVQNKQREDSERLLRSEAEKGKIEEGKKNITIPDWAKSVIVAELYQNDSDSMTDYFSTSVQKTVILAYSRTVRNNMTELKRACLNFEQTTGFAQGGKGLEFTDYGSYLPTYFLGTDSWNGWKVSKAKYTLNLETETGKNAIYKAFSEGRYFVPEEVKKALKQANSGENSGSIRIIVYSEKSVAVIGETKQIKDRLKDLGGKFNRYLTCGAGWIFPKNKENELNELLESL